MCTHINTHTHAHTLHTCGAGRRGSTLRAIAITTTDLVSKEAALRVTLGGKEVSVGGMCKGSGMIHPNMATMLGVVTTDAAVDVEVWRGMLRRATDASFNAVRRQRGSRAGVF